MPNVQMQHGTYMCRITDDRMSVHRIRYRLMLHKVGLQVGGSPNPASSGARYLSLRRDVGYGVIDLGLSGPVKQHGEAPYAQTPEKSVQTKRLEAP